ncbi:hypothetical protein T492DRAFT_937699 [Pavlovales sp. CCMP2436]|nr:hypothetical protein T492DRAFT_937699 [Pavlovales sp. CCMP2436]
MASGVSLELQLMPTFEQPHAAGRPPGAVTEIVADARERTAGMSAGSGAGFASAPARVCGVCAQDFAKYTCPRCAAQSCGLTCYRAHGAACTELFDRAQVEAALSATTATPETREGMGDILRRMRDQSLDSDGPPRGRSGEGGPVAEDKEAERVRELQQLATQGALEQILLTADEQLDFERHAANGSLSHYLDRTDAWWERVSAGSVERLSDGCFASRDRRAPAAIHELPKLAGLTARHPPASMRHLVLEMLACYTYTYRLFDCNPTVDTADAARCVLQLSAALNGDEREAYVSAHAALQSVSSRSSHPVTRYKIRMTCAVCAARRACPFSRGRLLSPSPCHDSQRGVSSRPDRVTQ